MSWVECSGVEVEPPTRVSMLNQLSGDLRRTDPHACFDPRILGSELDLARWGVAHYTIGLRSFLRWSLRGADTPPRNAKCWSDGTRPFGCQGGSLDPSCWRIEFLTESAGHQVPASRLGYHSLYSGLSRASRFDTPNLDLPELLPAGPGGRPLSQAKSGFRGKSVRTLTRGIVR